MGIMKTAGWLRRLWLTTLWLWELWKLLGGCGSYDWQLCGCGSYENCWVAAEVMTITELWLWELWKLLGGCGSYDWQLCGCGSYENWWMVAEVMTDSFVVVGVMKTAGWLRKLWLTALWLWELLKTSRWLRKLWLTSLWLCEIRKLLGGCGSYDLQLCGCANYENCWVVAEVMTGSFVVVGVMKTAGWLQKL